MSSFASSWSPLSTPNRGGAHSGGHASGLSLSSPRRSVARQSRSPHSTSQKRLKMPPTITTSILTHHNSHPTPTTPTKHHAAPFSLSSPTRQPRTPTLNSTPTPTSPHRTPSTPSTLPPPPTAACRFIPRRDASDAAMELRRHCLVGGKGGESYKENKGEVQRSVDNTTASPAPRPPGAVATGIETEFRRRMRGALLSIDDSLTTGPHSTTPTSSTGSTATVVNTDENESDDESRSSLRMLSFGSGSLTSPRSRGPRFPNPNDMDDIRVLPHSRAHGAARGIAAKIKMTRNIPAAPTRILDAPELVDDYYLNLISWSSSNVLAVALGQCVYLWNAANGNIEHLCTLDGADDYVTSVSWAEGNGCEHYIAVGTNNSAVQLWDSKELKLVRTMGGHTQRVGSLAWNKNWLSSGGRDSLIVQHDVRAANHQAASYVGHTQEVCGLKWNDDGSQLASGGNENYLCLWDASMSSRRAQGNSENAIAPRLTLSQHCAAVKALDWCPFHRGLLASGGGTADRTIKFWNTNSGAVLNSIDTGSQVCSLLWSKHNKEICSSHGFSENQLCLWNYPSMTKIQELKGHTARVLHMAQSPDGSSVVSAAADETLRFWQIFGSPPSSKKGGAGILGGESGSRFGMFSSIR